MTNNPITRINQLIIALSAIKETAIEVEKDLRVDNPLAEVNDAMIDAFEITHDDIVDGDIKISHEDLTILKNLITNP